VRDSRIEAQTADPGSGSEGSLKTKDKREAENLLHAMNEAHRHPTLIREFGHRTVSPFAVDLVCYDLRCGAPHTITLAISQDTQAAQDAVDAELVA